MQYKNIRKGCHCMKVQSASSKLIFVRIYCYHQSQLTQTARALPCPGCFPSCWLALYQGGSPAGSQFFLELSHSPSPGWQYFSGPSSSAIQVVGGSDHIPGLKLHHICRRGFIGLLHFACLLSERWYSFKAKLRNIVNCHSHRYRRYRGLSQITSTSSRKIRVTRPMTQSGDTPRSGVV